MTLLAEAPPPVVADGCAQLAWAASGAMALGGGVPAPSGILGRTEQVLASFAALAGADPGVTAAEVIGARAALRGRAERPDLAVSVGGATRLLRALDGYVAISLARPDDEDAVPAIVGDGVGEPWVLLAEAAARTRARDLVERARLLGVPAAVAGECAAPDAAWRSTPVAPAVPPADGPLDLQGALVVDLSSLWAGPLCARLLGAAGARVVKVESLHRPDGARRDPAFYDWLHTGQESVALDFRTAAGREQLAALLCRADVVIEASRPRALEQLGVAASQLDLRPGTVWASITGHGRRHPDRVAFGDDAAVAGGLVGWTAAGPAFVGDAIADPLTGIVTALAVAEARALGGGVLLDVAMAEVAATFAAAPLGCGGEHPVADGMVACTATGRTVRVVGPSVPAAVAAAPVLGADTARVRERFGPSSRPVS